MRPCTLLKLWAPLVLACAACGHSDPNARSPVNKAMQDSILPIRQLAAGLYGGPPAPVEAVITSAQELTSLWPGSDVPAVDFAREMVVFVALGERRTGGYSVEVTSATVSGDTLVVRYVERQPGPGCLTTQALTTPFHAVAIPHVQATPRFQRELVRVPC